MARPRKKIDEKALENYASIGCTSQEMAVLLGCSKDTLERRFAAAIEKGRSRLHMSLRRAQVKAALEGDKTMLVWLGKIILGQKEDRGFGLVGGENLQERLDRLADALEAGDG